MKTMSKICIANLQCTDDKSRSYQNVCNMSLESFSLAVIFIISSNVFPYLLDVITGSYGQRSVSTSNKQIYAGS